ncbi:MAG: 2-amino-4-hydroxy-6-hydroxymethyldihydropteridine diphosphokinase [Chromatiales bacterium]|jgi:2-amino-4-hydroxy-6-hydroxymethyldihydropteridine diphosphokinase|nr:2-amino-4-hydroxy-6-hydroxymethyldihydropteridine diphosphokinase [Chromatiales bacterium]
MTPGVFVSVGSNVDRSSSIRRGLELLEDRFGEVVRSPVYECPAVGFEGAPFYNLVIGFRTRMAPQVVQDELHTIEVACGRREEHRGFSPRPLDLDLLLYGCQVITSDALTLPHPDIDRYAFVLRPLADLAGDLLHPERGDSYRALWAQCGREDQPMRPVSFHWPTRPPKAASHG